MYSSTKRLSILKDTLTSHFHHIYGKDSFTNNVFKDYRQNLFYDLFPCELKSLENSTGSAFDELAKINSSTTLAINFFSMLKHEYPSLILSYEEKVGLPLRGGRPSNLDVVIKTTDKIIFIESKFFEPFYMESKDTLEHIDSYINGSHYQNVSKQYEEKWQKIFNKFVCEINEGKILYYNVIQMLKHLLSIFNKRESWQDFKEVIILNVGWNLNPKFLNIINDLDGAKNLIEINRKLEDEINYCISVINVFVKKELGLTNYSVLFKHYDELFKYIKNNKYYTIFKNKYLY